MSVWERYNESNASGNALPAKEAIGKRLEYLDHKRFKANTKFGEKDGAVIHTIAYEDDGRTPFTFFAQGAAMFRFLQAIETTLQPGERVFFSVDYNPDAVMPEPRWIVEEIDNPDTGEAPF